MRLSPELLTGQEVLREVKSSQHGLSEISAAERLRVNGKNSFPEPPRPHPFAIFLRQFTSPLIIILLVAVAILFFRSEHVDAIIVLSVLLINAGIGVAQEGKTQKTLNSLKNLAIASATVIRKKKHHIISDDEIVVGDLAVLSEGDRVPADIRLLRVSGLLINEALLTGESEPVRKMSEVLKEEDLEKQTNMAFKGTYVTSGGAIGVVVKTGTDTAMGAIYQELLEKDTEIPLQRDISRLSIQILAIVITVSIGLLVVNTMQGVVLEQTIALIVSLAVSIIPEGLPIVLTYVLAKGVADMARRHVLVKRMQAVETLGRTKILAVDKTGTITTNELAVVEVWTLDKGQVYEVSANGYSPKGVILRQGSLPLRVADKKSLAQLAQTAAICCTAILQKDKKGLWEVVGEPTEAAFMVLAEKLFVTKAEVEEQAVLVKDYGFDYTTKLHYVVHKYRGAYLVSVAGAPENFAQKLHLKTADKEEFETESLRMATKGLRVVALGHVLLPELPRDVMSHSLMIDGLVGIQDTLHPEVNRTVKRLRTAGIKTVMITGDHAQTAQFIATQAGIFEEGDRIIQGKEMDSFTDQELAQIVPETTVFARVTPSHKLRIVEAFRAAGFTIAMTGDGVNDAPSLSAADLGISMGLRGTEVAKEASDLILLNDNLSSLVAAVEEGRGIYEAIRRVVTYLFSGTFSLVAFIAIAIFVTGLNPLYPSQVIWLNFITDVLLVLALTSEPREKGLLNRGYKHPAHLLTVSILSRVVFLAIPMTAATLYAFTQTAHLDVMYASTLALTVLAVCHWVNAWNIRSSRHSLFNYSFLLANKPLIGMTIMAVLFQVAAVYVPFMQEALHTVPLAASDWVFVAIVALPVLALEEVRKSFLS